MNWLDPFDYNQNGKVDDEDWILEEEDRKRTEERQKKREEDRKIRIPEPPPTKAEIWQGLRAWITLGISGAVFWFFMKANMAVAALFGTLAVMLVLIIFFVKPWSSDKEATKEQKKNINPEALARYQREKRIFFSVLAAIVLIPLIILLTIYLWPPVSSVNIGMDYSSWEKHYKNGSVTTKVDGNDNSYKCSSFNQKVFGADAIVTYYFNRSDKLEYIKITSATGNKFPVEDQLRMDSRIKLRYRSPDMKENGLWVWQSRNYELVELYYGNDFFVIQPREYYYNDQSFEKVFQLKDYEFRWRSEEYYAQQRLENAIRANAERESRRQEYAAQKETTTKNTSYYWYGGSQYGLDDDPYDVQDYDNPDDFYYDHPDDFYDYEDAEEYWEENY